MAFPGCQDASDVLGKRDRRRAELGVDKLAQLLLREILRSRNSFRRAAFEPQSATLFGVDVAALGRFVGRRQVAATKAR